jgi:hypothetical protein
MLMRVDSEAKQAAEEGRDNQLLITSGRSYNPVEKETEELHIFCQNTKRDR